MVSFNNTINFTEETLPGSTSSLWATQFVFIYIVAEETSQAGEESITPSKLHGGAIIFSLYPSRNFQ